MNSIALFVLMTISPMDQARANVDVSVAYTTSIRNAFPALPDSSKRRYQAFAPKLDMDADEEQRLKQEKDALEKALDSALENNKREREENERLKNEIKPIPLVPNTPTLIPVLEEKPKPEKVASGMSFLGGIRLEVEPPAVAQSANDKPVKCTMYTGKKKYGERWCPNCPAQIAMAKAYKGTKLDITVSDELCPDNGPQQYPCWRWEGPGEEPYYPAIQSNIPVHSHTCTNKNCPYLRQTRTSFTWWHGGEQANAPNAHNCPHCGSYQNESLQSKDQPTYTYKLPKSMEELEGMVERSYSSTPHVAGALIGALHGRQQILELFEKIKTTMGYENDADFLWGREGAQAFDLLKMKGQWTAARLMGAAGRFAFSLKKGWIDQPDLPSSFTVGYKVNGDDVGFDVDMVWFKGLAKKLGLEGADDLPQGVMGAEDEEAHASKFGLLAGYYIIQAIRYVWMIFHPSCDLRLGGTISCIFRLTHGDELNPKDTFIIEFKEPPSVRFVMIWEFMLAIRRMVITADNLHLDFDGSRLIKKLDIPVKD